MAVPLVAAAARQDGLEPSAGSVPDQQVDPGLRV